MHRPADREGRPLTSAPAPMVGALPVCAAQRNTGMYASLGGTHSTAGGSPHPSYSVGGPAELSSCAWITHEMRLAVSLELKTASTANSASGGSCWQ